MKKFIVMLLSAILCFGLAACGEKDTTPIKESEIDSLYSNPDDFEGRTYEFTAQVFSVEKDSGAYYIQAFQDINNYGNNTVIVYDNTDTTINTDDYIRVKSSVTGEFKGENSLGGEVTAVQVQADSVEKITAAEAFTAEETIELNSTVTQGDYSATLEKVDFTEDETRIYITITNNSSSTFDVYADQGVIVQNGKQYESEYNYNYDIMSTEIQAGASAEGIIPYTRIDTTGFTYSFTGYDENFNELTFEFTIPALEDK